MLSPVRQPGFWEEAWFQRSSSWNSGRGRKMVTFCLSAYRLGTEVSQGECVLEAESDHKQPAEASMLAPQVHRCSRVKQLRRSTKVTSVATYMFCCSVKFSFLFHDIIVLSFNGVSICNNLWDFLLILFYYYFLKQFFIF